MLDGWVDKSESRLHGPEIRGLRRENGVKVSASVGGPIVNRCIYLFPFCLLLLLRWE